MPNLKERSIVAYDASKRLELVNGSESNYTICGTTIAPWFVTTKKQRNKLAFRAYHYGNYPAWQLRKMLGVRACFYSLKYHNLFLDRKYADKNLITDPETIAIWKKAVRKYLKPPFFCCIEVGIEGQIHVHVIADKSAGLIGIRRGGKVIKPIGDTEKDWLAVLSYMYKTPLPLTINCDDITATTLPDWQERLAIYHRGIMTAHKLDKKRVPELSFYVFM